MIPEVHYKIRYIPEPCGDYYCFLWVSQGQNIAVFKGSEVYTQVKLFEKGTSPFKTVKELHDWALGMPR